MKAIYYLGRYDFELNRSIVAETDTRAEFGRDDRTGRRAISTPQSVRKVLASHAHTLVVLEDKKLGLASGVPQESLDLIQGKCDRVDVHRDTGIKVWWCAQSG